MNSVVYRWVFEALRRYPARSAALFVLSILTSLADGVSISLLIPFLAVLFGGTSFGAVGNGWLSSLLEGISSLAGKGNEIYLLTAAILAMVCLRSVLAFVQQILESRMSAELSHSVRARIHENLLAVDYEYICINDNGQLLNTLDSDTWRTIEAITTVLAMFTNVSMVLVFTVILLAISWELTILVGVLVVAISLLLRVFDTRAKAASRVMVNASEALSAHAVQLFDAMRMIRAFGGEQSTQDDYTKASRRMMNVSVYMDRISGLAGLTQGILYAVVFVVVIFSALWLGIGQAALIAYLALLRRMQPYIQALDEARLNLASLSASVNAVSELLSLRPWAADAVGGQTLAELKEGVRFEHVTFAYRGKDQEIRNAVEDISLTIPVGKTTAIVGLSGAGKSTLINLLFRFHDPFEGRITVDGVPLTKIDLSWWRRQLAIAGQDADLINGTIRENIAYGLPDISPDAILEAARKACADGFISELPKGYETRVGERGVLLSAGQRQRIGLARALVRDGGILVLDEATNAIDSMTEAEVMESLEALHGRTVVVIAHRLSTTRMADQTIVLANGRVVEAGTPAELYAQDGLFSKMVKLQELTHIVGGTDYT